MSVCLSAVLFVSMKASAVTATIIPSGDATITDEFPTTPQGGSTILITGTSGSGPNNRSLLRFDLSSVPVNAVVTNASLSLIAVETAPTNSWFDLHRVNRQWSESAVTWNNRLSPVGAWTVAGASAPIDYVSSVTQSNFVADVGPYAFGSSTLMIADVQLWVNNSATNWGWILISELQGKPKTVKKFGSREAVANNQPVLTVQYYIPAGVAPVLVSPTVVGGSGVSTNRQFQVSFNAESNRTYAVEWTTTLSAWSVLTNLPSAPSNTTPTVFDTLTPSNRFYRVRTP